MVLEHGEFYEVSRVEHHVCELLVWIYPLVLGPADQRPLADGFAGCECAFVVVSDDPSEQTVVACRDAVMVVQRSAGHGVYEYPEFRLFGDPVGQLRVEGVDSLDKEDLAGPELDVFSVQFAYAGDEVVLRDLDVFSRKNPYDVVLHHLVVDGLEVVEVVASVREFRGIYPVDEIVVGGHGHRLYSAGLQLD